MTTECTTERLEFGGLRRQRVVGRFDGGELGSDGGGLLLRELAQRTGLFGRLSACFRDYREPQRTRHAVEVLVAARVLGLALGYEDLNDHDTLCQSKLWSLLCGAAGRGGPASHAHQPRGGCHAATVFHAIIGAPDRFCDAITPDLHPQVISFQSLVLSRIQI